MANHGAKKRALAASGVCRQRKKKKTYKRRATGGVSDVLAIAHRQHIRRHQVAQALGAILVTFLDTGRLLLRSALLPA